VSHEQFANVLLKSLSEEGFALLAPFLDDVELTYRQQIELPHEPFAYMVFPESGVISVVAKSPEGKDTEIALIGYEGVTGTACLLGATTTPHSTYVQIPGSGWRIPVADLLSCASKSREINKKLLLFTQSLSVQTASTALANAQADAQTRLARWLLMIHDRTRDADLRITHELLAVMLALRRPWVTETLNGLQALGYIALKRQIVTVIDRRGLVSVANGFYGLAEAEYKTLIG
jgi:CRP-like cAMP-binding protein